MDEMKLVENFCAAVPPPEPARLEQIYARVLATAEQAPSRPRLRGPGLRWPRAALAGGVAVVTAAAVLAGLGLPFSRAGAPTSVSADDVLRHAAQAAYTQPVAHSGQYIYTEVTGPVSYPTASGQLATKMAVVQSWQSADGTRPGAIKDQNTCGVLAEPGPAALIGTPTGLHSARPLPTPSVPPKLPPIPAHCDATILATSWSPPASTYAGLQTLPTGTQALLAYLNAHYQQLTPPGTHLAAGTKEWSAITTILESLGIVPGRLEAAMFRALASIPGRAIYPRTTDYLGRTGTAVGWTWGGYRWELIFNPGTYQFMGDQQVALAGNDQGVRVGTRVSGTALVRAAVVNSAPKVTSKMAFMPFLWQSFAPGLPNTK